MAQIITGSNNTSEIDIGKRPLSKQKFTAQDKARLVDPNQLTREELQSVEYDSQLTEEEIQEGTVYPVDGEIIEEFQTDFEAGECDYWEYNPNSYLADEDELKRVTSLKNCKTIPEPLKDQTESEISFTKLVGKIGENDRIKIKLENTSTDDCLFIESIRVLSGTSNSIEEDENINLLITQNNPNVTEQDMVDFARTKLQFDENTPSSLIDGMKVDFPPCLKSTNDKIGILLGPRDTRDEYDPGTIYEVGNNLPPGSNNLLGIIGSTGVSGIDCHIHAEWADIGRPGGPPRYWTVEQFTNWLRENNRPVLPGIRTRATNALGSSTGIAGGGCAAYFTVQDLLKFVVVDKNPLSKQLSGSPPLDATPADFQSPPDRNYAQHRTGPRYHYGIDTNITYGKNIADCGTKFSARRVYLRPGVKVEKYGTGQGMGNGCLLRHPDGEGIVMLHFACFWDNEKNAYWTLANPKTTMKASNAGPGITVRRQYITKL
jgi:hypothetical protein